MHLELYASDSEFLIELLDKTHLTSASSFK